NTDQTGIITLDMTMMNRVLHVDAEARVARIEAGIYGPALESALQAQGFTLSHYPQSFEFSTLGGWIAARGAGHQSIRYGKAEDWLISATLATPAGLWKTEAFPASAVGPQLVDLVAGSEGALGVITEAEVRIHPVPEVKDYRGYIFTDYSAAVAAARALMQSDIHAAMIRLSDPDETFFLQALHMGRDADPSARFCLMLVGIEGDKIVVDASRERSQSILEAHGGMHMGEHFGTSWYKGRFTMPYLRDPLMDRGLAVDTLETATRWSNIEHLHTVILKAIGDAMAARPGRPGAKGIVMAHISHAYEDGASLYFTYVYVRDCADEYGQWLSIKQAASETILDNGGTISHHHGVGVDHLPYIQREKGPIALNLLRALKHQIDPLDILNPGKLIPKE
ncbi:MAG: FAD-binding oxidoreductase, partial [Candidatus Hydrogenedentales bacterium]